uniref:Uncharacterized protein n=1 Tax=Setaria italica TaxID=4555 RepID=K3Y0M6_SETIT
MWSVQIATQSQMFASPQFIDFIVQYDTAKFSLSPQTPHGDANSRLSITVFTNLPNKSSSPRDIAAQQHIA